MLAWHLGLRYLRRRRAAWLALGAITMTVAAPVVVGGVCQGFVDVISRQVRAMESDLTCEPRFTQHGVSEQQASQRDLMAIPGITAAAPFVDTFALIAPRYRGNVLYDQSQPCQVDAVDWRGDSALGRLTPSMLHAAPTTDLHDPPLPPDRRGSGFLTRRWRDHLALLGVAVVPGCGLLPLPPSAAPEPGVVIGRELSYSTMIDVGMRVQFIGPSGSASGTSRINAEIADTRTTGIYETDKTAVLMPLPLGQSLLGYTATRNAPAPVGGWRLQVDDAKRLQQLRDAVVMRTDLRVLTWEERRGNFVKSAVQQRNLMIVVMIVIQAVAIFIVYAVFSTLVAEKRHDLGVLLGIGASRGAVCGAFLTASLAACLGGGVLGWGLGWGALAALNPVTKYFGIPLFPDEMFYSPDTPISFDPRIPLLFLAVMTVVGLLAALLPAWRAGRIDPVAILREGG